LRNFEIRSRHPRHAHLGAICNLGTRTARSLSVCEIWRA